jgi:hypothetical protein
MACLYVTRHWISFSELSFLKTSTRCFLTGCYFYWAVYLRARLRKLCDRGEIVLKESGILFLQLYRLYTFSQLTKIKPARGLLNSTLLWHQCLQFSFFTFKNDLTERNDGAWSLRPSVTAVLQWVMHWQQSGKQPFKWTLDLRFEFHSNWSFNSSRKSDYTLSQNNICTKCIGTVVAAPGVGGKAAAELTTKLIF